MNFVVLERFRGEYFVFATENAKVLSDESIQQAFSCTI